MRPNVFYINMASATDRREAMESKLEKSLPGWTWNRFNAITGDNRSHQITRTELGCFLSHRSVIELSTDTRHTIIFEDDVVFAEGFEPYLNQVLNHINRTPDEWDILFLHQMTMLTNVQAIYHLLNMKEKLRKQSSQSQVLVLNDCKNFYASSAAAYIINFQSKSKILGLLNQSEGLGYPLPIDLIFKNLIDSDTLKCKFVIPYLVGVEATGESSIQTSEKLARSTLLEDLSNLYFKDSDTDALLLKYQKNQPQIDLHPEKFIASQIIFRRLIM